MKRAAAKPLAGLKIVVTRPRDQAGELMEALQKLGAKPKSVPAIMIRPIRPNPELARALAEIDSYHYLVFTSRNGVEVFSQAMKAKGLTKKKLAHLVVACIGPATELAVKKAGLKCWIKPRDFVAEALLAAFPRDLRGRRVLLPRAKEAREVLPEGLERRGAIVDVIPVYESVPARPAPKVPKETDIVIFTSGSTVTSFMTRAKIPKKTKIAVIGPITQAEVEKHGRRADIVAEEFTAQGLVKAIIKSQVAATALRSRTSPGGKPK